MFHHLLRKMGLSSFNTFYFPNKSFRFLSEATDPTNPSSFTLSYLINECKLSAKSALDASKRINIKAQEKPDSVLALFKDYGFNEHQISKIIEKLPILLLSCPCRNLKPKFEFFKSIIPSESEVVKLICSDPWVLKPSLENHIIPSYQFLKELVHTDENVRLCIYRFPWYFNHQSKSRFESNIKLLKDIGVPKSNIERYFVNNLKTCFKDPTRFAEAVNVLLDMGFRESNTVFLIALRAMTDYKKSSWEKKIKVFQSLGWTETEFKSAFKRMPSIMCLSESNIKASMEFFLKEIGLKPSELSLRPVLLILSLEKRVIPRHFVIKTLLSKNLLKSTLIYSRYFIIGEKDFLKNFVAKYDAELPGLWNAYEQSDLNALKKLTQSQIFEI